MADAAVTVLAGSALICLGLAFAAKLGGVMPEEIVRLLMGDKEQR